MRGFNEWKTITIARLLELKKNYMENAKAIQTLDAIIYKVHYAKLRDLARVLFLLHAGSSDVPELLDLLPTTEEVEEWLK